MHIFCYITLKYFILLMWFVIAINRDRCSYLPARVLNFEWLCGVQMTTPMLLYSDKSTLP